MFKWLRGKEKQGSWKVSILFCYNWGSQCQHLHPCLFLTLFLLLYITYSLFLIIGRFYQDWYRRRKKWVIHYNPKISRKAESIISLLLLFKSSPQSFPPPTHLPSPPLPSLRWLLPLCFQHALSSAVPHSVMIAWVSPCSYRTIYTLVELVSGVFGWGYFSCASLNSLGLI